MKRCLIFTLCAILTLCLCGCADTPKAADPDQFRFSITQHTDNTYDITVRGNEGSSLFHQQHLPYQPMCYELSEDVMQIICDTANGTQWTAFCDVSKGRTSDVFGNYVAANTTKVAYIDYLTEKYWLFVRDIYDESVYLEATELPGLTVDKSGALFKSVKVKNDQVILTYLIAGGENTVTMAIPE